MKKVLSLLLTVMLLFALAVPAMPLEYTPSVEGAEAPEVVESTDSAGNTYDAILDFGNSEEVGVAKGEEIEMEVTPASEADEAAFEEIKEALEAAIEEIQDAETVADLVPEIERLLAGTEYTVEDFVVSDVFDVSLIDENGVTEVPAGATLRFKIKSDVRPGEVFFLLHNYAPGKWEIVENATIDANGVISAAVTSLSPFAIVKLGDIAVEPGTGEVTPGTGTVPPSPQTGDSFPALYVACALLCACAAVVLFKKAGKKA